MAIVITDTGPVLDGNPDVGTVKIPHIGLTLIFDHTLWDPVESVRIVEHLLDWMLEEGYVQPVSNHQA
jgi:hypothetical protein